VGESQRPPRGAERRLVIDRFEGDLAVAEVEAGATFDLPRWLLPVGAREGDHLRFRSWTRADGARRFELAIDPEATDAARAAAEATLARLRARDPGGDIEL
jgi:hypothetical protein